MSVHRDSDGLHPSALSMEKGRGQKPKMAASWSEMVRAWPYCTFLIVLNEFCQKFASLSTVLGLYLLNVLKFSASETTIFMNVYQIFGGILPLFGSALADGYIGKFRTILYGSLLYGVGKIVMSGASFMHSGSPFHPWIDYVGIAIIVVGMGGIIPCVASFGGDQFEPHQEKMISVFFSIFYASINAGALISTVLMPVLRSQPCLDQDSCYPLSFGVSAAFMIVAAVVFVVGSKFYKKQPPKGNVFGDVYRTITIAVRNKKRSAKVRDHWLDYYLDTHECRTNNKCMRLKRRKGDDTLCERAKFLEDIRSLMRILVMYIPLPMFWALYDQQYSVWLIQAIQMDCRLWGDVLLLPDMMQFVNPVLILVFIFLFESIIYPIVSRFVRLTPLRKMVAGGVLASLAFVVSALVQVKVNATLPTLPGSNHAFVSFMNNLEDCSMTVRHCDDISTLPANYSLVNVGQSIELFEVQLGKEVTWKLHYEGKGCSGDRGKSLPKHVKYTINEGNCIYFVSIGPNGAFLSATDPSKPTGGTGEFSVSINLALDDFTYAGNLALCRMNTVGTTAEHPCDPQRPEDFYFYETEYDKHKTDLKELVPYQTSNLSEVTQHKASLYAFKPVRPGNWMLYYMHNRAKSIGQKTMSKEEVQVNYTGVHFQVEDQGGVYAIVLTGKKNNPQKHVFQVVPSNTVNILWQVPQIAIITAAEILFSITGYEFAYSQSGVSMKSIMQALWFLTVAVGDLIIILVTLLEFGDMAVQFAVYAVVMLVVIFIFALMSIFYYEYRTNDESESADLEDDDYEDIEPSAKKATGTDPCFGNALRERGTNGSSVGVENLGYRRSGGDDDTWSKKM